MTCTRTAPRHRWAPALGAAIVAASLAAACSSSSTPSAGPAATTPGGGGSGTATTATVARPAKPTKVTAPKVTGPVTGGTYGTPFNPLAKRLATTYGYQEAEYFISGTATSYKPAGTWGEDGAWTATTDATAPFTTRIIVRLPTDKAKFNGTVVVEWLNVSAGMDADPDWGFAHDELMRQGYGYVAVSAQKVGVGGGAGIKLPIPGFDAKPLKEWDPQRYASLDHPGDAFSYDIFSQAAAVTRDPTGVRPFDGYPVTTLLAAGESQSAFRMTTYVNAIHPLVRLFDGFLIHSRGPGGATVTDSNTPPVPKTTKIRADLTEPVFQLETETDLFGLGFYPARQPDTDKLRTWEIAGTSHADQFTLNAGIESGHEWDPKANIDFSALCGTINNGPQTYVVRALFSALRAWVVNGTAPPKSPLIEVKDGAIVRDADGNAKGGIRTAAVDAPVSTLSGEQAEATSVICSLFGFTKPFTPERLKALYPTHEDYVMKVKAATQRAVDAGHILPADQPEILDAAQKAAVPG